MKYIFIFTFLFSSLALAEVSLNPIEVDAPYSLPGSQAFESSADEALPYTDTADYLRSISGLTSGRMGGHGLEPVLRGQSQEQINIVSDGAYVYGGCPNRMDPTTVYVSLDSYDEIEVVRGYQSVLNGPGASGGSLIFKRKAPQLKEDFSVQGKVSSMYDSNPGLWSLDGQALMGNKNYYLKANAGIKSSDNYKDGEGNAVQSSFDDLHFGLTAGVTLAGAHYYLSYERSEISEALFPGAKMDSPASEADIYRLGFEKNFDLDWLKEADWSVYYSDVYHVMDNYSLRTASPMLRRLDSDSETAGLRLKNGLVFFGQEVDSILEWRKNTRDAERLQGMMPLQVNTLQSLLWPGIEISDIGLALETESTLSKKISLQYGLRYDYVEVDYTRADEVSALTGKSANDLYNQFYGYSAEKTNENNVGALLRVNLKASDSLSFYTGLSRSLRSADATERGLANLMVMMGNNMSWVGNPQISPEKHHQLDIGFKKFFKKGGVDLSLYANSVQDFILRDSAKSQDGILVNSPVATIYRNIDAMLYGLEAQAQYNITPKYRLATDLVYTYGQNKDEGRALAQIPPLQGHLYFSWTAYKDIEVLNTLRWAAQATRVDDNSLLGSGRDSGNTSGYALWDLGVVVKSFKPLTLTVGVSNLLDKKCANHLNRSNILDGTELQVNEPGRSFYLKATMPF